MSIATLEEIAELRRLCTDYDLDGVLQYSFTGTSYLPFRTYDFLIGHDPDEIGGSNANPFQGNMSYFRIRNVAPYQGASYTPEFV